MARELPKVIVIVGPTASGKSDLAVKLAKKFNGEVVSADSRQVYRGLDIGSGKILRDKSKNKYQKSKIQANNQKGNGYFYCGVRHHLLDVASPKQTFTVKQYVELAKKAIADIVSRGKLPIIAGGTGFYIQALVDGITIPEVPPNLVLRKRLAKKSAEELFQMLKQKDPERAATIESKNPRRLIRALEIAAALGRVPKLRKQKKYNALFIGILKDPKELKRLIHKRLMARLRGGMIAEVRRLRDKEKLSWKRLENFGLEYRYIAHYLQRKLPYNEMVQQLERAIWQYAKRQMTWFKKDQRIHWIKNKNETMRLVDSFLASKLKKRRSGSVLSLHQNKPTNR